jgi:transposase
MGKIHVVALSKQEREELQTLISTGAGAAQLLRNARILLKADQSRHGPGWEDQRISEALEVSVATIERVRLRFREGGLRAALGRRQPVRASKPRAIDGEQEAHLIAIACSPPPSGQARWTIRLLTDKLIELEYVETVSHETVRQVMRANQLKPWLKKMWVIPPKANAEFVYYMEDVLEVYTRPQDQLLPLICLDERPVQLLSDKHPPLPILPDHPFRYDYEYEREGVTNLFMFFAPLLAWRHVKVTKQRTKVDFAHCIRDLVDLHFTKAQRITVVRDQLNTHGPDALYEAFPPSEARRLLQRIEFHSTPKHGSWLNMAEIELSVLSRQCLDRRIPDPATLTTELNAWQATRNAARSTVDWRFTTADARIKLKRLYPSIQS